jgi:hypothetical protein
MSKRKYSNVPTYDKSIIPTASGIFIKDSNKRWSTSID